MAEYLQAAVFDADGTLLDSREYILQAFEYALASHNLEVPDRDVLTRYVGRSLLECYAGLAPGTAPEPLIETHSDFQSDKFELVTCYEGVVKTLEALRARGFKLGIFSSRYGNLQRSLEHAGIADFFDAIVDGQQVTRAKPDPEGVLLALEQLGVEPENAAMIGDAPVDILAGKAAGVHRTIAITHGFGTREDLLAAGPDALVDDFLALQAMLLASI